MFHDGIRKPTTLWALVLSRKGCSQSDSCKTCALMAMEATVTAVFSFAFDGKVLLATDTLRVDPGGCFAPRTVEKSYCWKGFVPFGGAGTGAFIRQVAEFMAVSEADYAADTTGFRKAFADGRQTVLDAIEASNDPKKKAAAHGVVLAAIPQCSARGEILRLDFSTGEVIVCEGTVFAEGTRPPDFLENAKKVLAEMSGSGLEADRLALECMARAVSLCPEHVGWPMDLRVAEASPTGDHKAFHLRLDPRIPEGFMSLE